MINAARVLAILAGCLGMPAVACSGCWSELGDAYARDTGDQSIASLYSLLETAALLASLGAIAVGSGLRRFGKTTSGAALLAFSGIFAFLVVQMNFFGLVSSLMLLVAAVMVFVAPAEEFGRPRTTLPRE